MYNILNELLYLFPEEEWDTFLISTNPGVTEEMIMDSALSTKICTYALSYNTVLPLSFIYNNPDINWFWHFVSERSDVTMEFVLKFLHKDLDWKRLSMHKNITFADISGNPELPWNYSYVSLNPNINIDMVRATLDTFPWVWQYLSKNEIFTIHDIMDNSDLNWDYFSLFENNTFLNSVFTHANRQLIVHWDFDWYYLSKNIDLKLPHNRQAFIENNNYDWDYHGLSINSTLTFDLVKLFPNKPWAYLDLSTHAELTVEFVAENVEFYWYWPSVFLNLKFDHLDIINNPEIPWNYYYMSHNHHLSEKTIILLPNAGWSYSALSQNLGLSLKFIESNLDKDWDFYYVSENPHITPEFILNHRELNWNFHILSKNKFTKSPEYRHTVPHISEPRRQMLMELSDYFYLPAEYSTKNKLWYNGGPIFHEIWGYIDDLNKKI